jgi:hypothetical protein
LRITILEKRWEEEHKMSANMEKLHACVECIARSSSVLEVERLSAENGSLHASIHHCKMIQT